MKIKHFLAKVIIRGYQTAANNIRSLPNSMAGVFYDWDGTLIKFRGKQFLDSMNEVLSMFGHPKMQSLVGSKSIRDTFALATKCPIKTEEALDAFRHNFFTYPLSINDLMPGALDLLERLQKLGLPQGVVSNLDHKALIREIGTLGLDEYFSVVIGSTNVQDLKPSPTLILQALSAVGIDPSRSVYVGDSLGDVTAAIAAGCTSVLVGTSVPEASSDIIVTNLSEFGNMIAGALTISGDLS